MRGIVHVFILSTPEIGKRSLFPSNFQHWGNNRPEKEREGRERGRQEGERDERREGGEGGREGGREMYSVACTLTDYYTHPHFFCSSDWVRTFGFTRKLSVSTN